MAQKEKQVKKASESLTLPAFYDTKKWEIITRIVERKAW